MAINDALLNVAADAMGGAATHLSLHSAQPDATGSNETTAARQVASWAVAANGDLTLSATESFTGGTASGAVSHVGLWDASTAGTFYGWLPISGGTAFDSSGNYDLTAITLAGSAA